MEGKSQKLPSGSRTTHCRHVRSTNRVAPCFLMVFILRPSGAVSVNGDALDSPRSNVPPGTRGCGVPPLAAAQDASPVATPSPAAPAGAAPAVVAVSRPQARATRAITIVWNRANTVVAVTADVPGKLAVAMTRATPTLRTDVATARAVRSSLPGPPSSQPAVA